MLRIAFGQGSTVWETRKCRIDAVHLDESGLLTDAPKRLASSVLSSRHRDLCKNLQRYSKSDPWQRGVHRSPPGLINVKADISFFRVRMTRHQLCIVDHIALTNVLLTFTITTNSIRESKQETCRSSTTRSVPTFCSELLPCDNDPNHDGCRANDLDRTETSEESPNMRSDTSSPNPSHLRTIEIFDRNVFVGVAPDQETSSVVHSHVNVLQTFICAGRNR